MKNRILYFDILNIVATFGVVAMHCNGMVHTYRGGLGWVQAFSVDTLFYCAVPIFMMLTGANLLGYHKKYGTKEYFKRRFFRTVIPFLFWATVAYIWRYAAGRMEAPSSIADLVSAYLNTEMMSIYWFFFALFSVYLAIPVLSRLVGENKKENSTTLWYFVGMGFLFSFFLPSFLTMLGVEYNDAFMFPLSAGGYIVYAVLGYLVANHDFSQRNRIFIYVLGVASLLLHFVTTLVFSSETDGLYREFWGYINYPTFFYALAVFVFAKRVKWGRFFRSEKQVAVLTRMASASFGVYLIHMFVIEDVMLVGLGIPHESLFLRLAAPFLVYLFCVLVSILFKKIPGLKHIMP